MIHEDEEAVKLLSQYDNVVYLFMSSKDIYKLEDQVIALQGISLGLSFHHMLFMV